MSSKTSFAGVLLLIRKRDGHRVGPAATCCKENERRGPRVGVVLNLINPPFIRGLGVAPIGRRCPELAVDGGLSTPVLDRQTV